MTWPKRRSRRGPRWSPLPQLRALLTVLSLFDVSCTSEVDVASCRRRERRAVRHDGARPRLGAHTCCPDRALFWTADTRSARPAKRPAIGVLRAGKAIRAVRRAVGGVAGGRPACARGARFGRAGSGRARANG